MNGIGCAAERSKQDAKGRLLGEAWKASSPCTPLDGALLAQRALNALARRKRSVRLAI